MPFRMLVNSTRSPPHPTCVSNVGYCQMPPPSAPVVKKPIQKVPFFARIDIENGPNTPVSEHFFHRFPANPYTNALKCRCLPKRPCKSTTQPKSRPQEARICANLRIES